MYTALPFISCFFYILAPLKRPCLYLAMFVQGMYVFLRGFSLGRLPLVGPHDTLTFLALSTALFSILFDASVKNKKQYRWFVSVTVVVLSILGLFSRVVNSPLPPVIKTIWFELHVIMAFASYGLFGLGALLGTMCLISEDKDIEPLQYKAILIGYFVFSVSMVFGGIWAFLAWSSYWIWTPKELWTSMLWLTLTLYLHLRYRAWWKNGKGIVIVGILNYLVVLFTYLGVSLLMKSSHSF